MTALPHIVCLCPTYGRPGLLENAIQCYLAQDYPSERRRLLILDDANQIPAQDGDGWQVIRSSERFATLPAKYNALVRLASSAVHPRPFAFCVWDDDDVYLPWHLSAHAEILAERGWSLPDKVWTVRDGEPQLQSAAGDFHGALAIRRELLERVGGWPSIRRAGFARRMQRLLEFEEPAGDPATLAVPSYVFRWGSPRHRHSRDFMDRPGNTTWYDEFGQSQRLEPWGDLVPRHDENAEVILAFVERFRRRRYVTDDVVSSLLELFSLE